MANTLTSLIPDAEIALDVVSRELVGFIPAVMRDSSADQLAIGQTLRSFVTPSNSAGGDITPAMSIPSAADQTIGNKPFTIQKSRYYPFSWSGAQAKAMNQGAGFLTVQQDQIAQAIRAAVNAMESDIAIAAKNGGSRAYGTAGTAPFGTANDLSDVSQVGKILDDNGTPGSDRHLIIGTTAAASLIGKQSSLFKVNEAGTDQMLRRGIIGDLVDFQVGRSGQVSNATAGTGSGYLINNSGGYAVGDTALTVDTGTGTILAGDVITIGSYKYVVDTALAANVVTIAAPGLVAAAADNASVTVNATSVRNMAFRRNAILLGTRLPESGPNGEDMAIQREVITDPWSGISFELALYPGFRMGVFHVSVNWGVYVLKPEHIAVLLG